MSNQRQFTICILLYGDYPELATRCLSPRLLDLQPRAQIRVGLNACGKNTRRYVDSLIQRKLVDDVFVSETNIFKYPMMRRMLYDAPAIASEYVMWLDDDTCLKDNGQTPLAWLAAVQAKMADADMLGSKYTLRLYGEQHRWIEAQPWYRAHPEIRQHHKVTFITGGWWTIRTEILRRYDWPTTELQHNGGDSMLGCLIEQQGLRLLHFRDGVNINWDPKLGGESKAIRRGMSQPPIGVNYTPQPQIPATPDRTPTRLRFDLEL